MIAVGSALVGFVAACNLIAGFDAYRDCKTLSCPDAAGDTGDVDAGGQDASDAAPPPDAFSFDGPSVGTSWATGIMPNPVYDAAVTALPVGSLHFEPGYTPSTYDGGAVLTDPVTQLSWLLDVQSTASGGEPAAEAFCKAQGAGWRVPTRIELLTLLDFTQPSSPYDPPQFNSSLASHTIWTISPDRNDPSRFWVVNFGGGTASTQPSSSDGYALCVSGTWK